MFNSVFSNNNTTCTSTPALRPAHLNSSYSCYCIHGTSQTKNIFIMDTIKCDVHISDGFFHHIQTTTNRNKVIQNTFKKNHLQILAVSIMHFCFFLVVILYLISQQPIICITRNIIQKDPLKENNIHNLKDPFLILRRCPNLPCQYKNDPEFRHLCPQLSTFDLLPNQHIGEENDEARDYKEVQAAGPVNF